MTTFNGQRLVTSVATVAPDGKRFVSALWQLDPDGATQPRRLTRSAKGESSAAFLPDGSLLFTSARPDPEAKGDANPDGKPDEDRSALWLLPAGGGEARLVANPPGGVKGLAVAKDASAVVLAVPVLPGSGTLEEDEERAKARKDAGVNAQLFETFPIRNWDHYMGPRETRLFFASGPERPDDGRLGELRSIAEADGNRLDEQSFDVTPDGSTVITGWRRRGDIVVDLAAIDSATGDRKALVKDDTASHYAVRSSPDGRLVACAREIIGTPEKAHRTTLLLVHPVTGESWNPAPDLDLAPPTSLEWSPDSSALFFTADEDGRGPVFRLDLVTRQVFRLSADGAFSDLCVSPDGYTDVMAAVDAAVARPDIDGERMAATTDHPPWWQREFGDPDVDPERYVAHSPHRHAAQISTPMLVIHGERDHRVPIGEALRLWTDLSRHGVDAKFLYFPDENHWILKPQHARVWYETVLSWLDHHLLGKEWQRPAML